MPAPSCSYSLPPGPRDLEGEWRALYPCSLLTARHLKSRLTVYQRTHQERSAPNLPMQAKEQVPPVKKEKEVVTYARRDWSCGWPGTEHIRPGSHSTYYTPGEGKYELVHERFLE